MANFLLLHGASSTGWLWHRVESELARRGHHSAAPDLPCADPTADLHRYIDVACDAARTAFGSEPFAVVAQSLAGFVAPAVAEREKVTGLTLIAAMIPLPGETGFEWWQATGQADAQRDYLDSLGFAGCDPLDPEIVFIHDFDPQLRSESIQHVPEQQSGPLSTPCPFSAWPDVPMSVVGAAEDRLFPLAFMRNHAQDRLGMDLDTIPGGHLAVLTQAPRVVEHLLSLSARA